MITAELRGGNKPSLNEALGWIGSKVDDIYGASVGRLEDVWIDPGTGAPKWLLVKEGRFGGRTTLIPFEDATAGAGHVWIPYERDVVRDAPAVSPGAPLTQSVESALRSHYASNKPTVQTHRGRGHAPEHDAAAAPAAAAATVAATAPAETQQVPQYQLAQETQARHDPHQPLPPVPPSPPPVPPARRAPAPQPQQLQPSRPRYSPPQPRQSPPAPQPRPAARAPLSRRTAYQPPAPQPPAYTPPTPGYYGYTPPQPPAQAGPPQYSYAPQPAAYVPPRTQARGPAPAPRQTPPPPPPALAPAPPAVDRQTRGPLGTDDPDRPVAIPIIHGLDQPYRVEVHLEGDLRISGELKGFSIEPAGPPSARGPAPAPEPGQ